MSSWMFSSHVFSKDGWLRPSRNELAEVLANPPHPPFVITVADSGKKHVLFRARVNHSSDKYFIQLDENTIFIDREIFKAVLALVEDAYQYFSKDSILTGDYNQAAIMKAGLATWQKYENQFKPIRHKFKDMLKVACFVARKML